MKRYANFITWTIRAAAIFALANVVILIYGVGQGNPTAQTFALIILAVALLLWPDPQDRKINSEIKNPYKDAIKKSN